MSFIYVYTNDYFDYTNTRKIGSTLNPYIRFKSYITYYREEGSFEYLFKLNCNNPYEIEEKIKDTYLIEQNTRKCGSSGGTEIYTNIDIKEQLIKCFHQENIKYEELDPSIPPITKKYSNNTEKEFLSNYKKEKRLKGESINYNIYLTKIPNKNEILDEIVKEYPGDLIKRSEKLINNSIPYLISDRLAIFDVPITDYKCSLNKVGRKKYGKLQDLVFSGKSKVGTKYGLINLPEIRKSRFTESLFQFNGNELEEIVLKNIQNIVSEDKRHLITWEKKLKYTVLEYREGDFFSEHKDHKSNKNHYGTLLIFPPAIDYLEHTGGEFVIETENCDVVIPSAINKKWIFIAFQTQMKHACHKILSGRRIVIKLELKLKKNYENVPDPEKIPMPVCCDGGIYYSSPDETFSDEDICCDGGMLL